MIPQKVFCGPKASIVQSSLISIADANQDANKNDKKGEKKKID